MSRHASRLWGDGSWDRKLEAKAHGQVNARGLGQGDTGLSGGGCVPLLILLVVRAVSMTCSPTWNCSLPLHYRRRKGTPDPEIPPIQRSSSLRDAPNPESNHLRLQSEEKIN